MINIALIWIVSWIHIYFRYIDHGRFLILNDSKRYFAMGRGILQYPPFHKRWLLPYLFKYRDKAWISSTLMIVSLLPVVTYLYLTSLGLTTAQAFFGSMLVLGLNGIYKMNVLHPILVDSYAIFFSLLSAISFLNGNILTGIMFSVIGGCIKESTPVFSFLFGFNALALLGFVSPILCRWYSPHADKDMLGRHGRLDDFIKTSDVLHKGRWFHPAVMLAPWGVCLIALLSTPPVLYWVMLALLVSYGQVVIATDSVRLYQQSFPVLVYAACLLVPAQFYLILVLVHWLNPYTEMY